MPVSFNMPYSHSNNDYENVMIMMVMLLIILTPIFLLGESFTVEILIPIDTNPHF